MTVEEKLGYIGGVNWMYTKSIDRLGIHRMKMSDGPQGLGTNGKSTAYPSTVTLAATWNENLAYQYGKALGRDCRARNVNVILGPAVNIYRAPMCGRNFEYMGEDPYLTSRICVGYIKGVQDQGVMATVKHFVANNSDYDRNNISNDIDERTLNEIYFPAYKAAIQEAEVGAVMTSYNLMNGIYTTENPWLLKEVLRNQWGFKGFVVSDWGSVGEMMNHRYAKDEKEAAYKGIKAGLDMEMVSECYSKNLVSLVKEGKVSIKLVDDAVRRILEQKYKLGLFDDPFRYCDEERERTVIGSQESRKEACYVSERSIVLLKNENSVLPLSSSIKKVALIGALSKSQKDMCGAWSCAEVGKVVTLYEAMEKRGVDINYNDGYDLKTNKIVNLDQTLAAARQSDVVIVAMGEQAWESGEMRSKGDISIAAEQQRLVSELVKTGKPVVVLMMCGRPVIFNEVRRDAPAILCTWWLGSEAGNAICNVLWGDYNPSGKLPMTFPQHNGQIPLYYQYKSTGRPTALGGWCAKYIDIPTEPAYPFGYGLSYTTFNYSDVKLLPGDGKGTYTRVAVTVTNTGKCEGEEVVQLYVRDEVASITRPIKELKGFEKIKLNPGESKTVTFDVKDEQLGFYNNQMKFIVEKGDFTLMVGGNSRDLQEIKYILN